jgi:hypothetical protein
VQRRAASAGQANPDCSPMQYHEKAAAFAAASFVIAKPVTAQ